MTKAKQTTAPAPPRAEGLRLLSEQTAYEFNGHTYMLSMTHRVILHWEQVTGMSFFADIGSIFDRPSLKALSAMLFCLLSANGYDGTLETMQEHLFQVRNLKAASEGVNAAYLVAQIQAADDPDPHRPTPAT